MWRFECDFAKPAGRGKRALLERKPWEQRWEDECVFGENEVHCGWSRGVRPTWRTVVVTDLGYWPP